MSSPDDPSLGDPPPPPFPPGRGTPPEEAVRPDAGATDPTAPRSDVGPPVVLPVSAVPPPPPPTAGTALGGHEPPPSPDPYPVRFDVAYPDRLSRLPTLLRLPLLLPLWLLGYVLQYVVFPVWIGARVAVICKRTYPRWLFDAGASYLAWTARLNAYAFLQTDRYPAFDADGSPVTLEYDYPEPRTPSRWKGILWRLVFVIPHFVVLAVLFIAVLVVVWIAWFAIVFTGRYPRGMFDFVTGVWRWNYRVAGYFLGFTDRLPPFSLAPVAGSAGGATTTASGIVGLLAAGGVTAGIIGIAVWNSEVTRASVNYAALEAGDGRVVHFLANLGNEDEPHVVMALNRVIDPGDRLVQVLEAGDGERVVVFEWLLATGDQSAHVEASPARLKVRLGHATKTYSAELATLGNSGTPATLGRDAAASLRVVFVVPEDAEPLELRFDPDFHPRGGILYAFE